MTKPAKWVCTQRRLRSPGHLPSLIRVFAVHSLGKGLMFLYADSEDWSDWADAQAVLSLCWAHSHFVGFCHVMAHIISSVFCVRLTGMACKVLLLNHYQSTWSTWSTVALKNTYWSLLVNTISWLLIYTTSFCSEEPLLMVLILDKQHGWQSVGRHNQYLRKITPMQNIYHLFMYFMYMYYNTSKYVINVAIPISMTVFWVIIIFIRRVPPSNFVIVTFLLTSLLKRLFLTSTTQTLPTFNGGNCSFDVFWYSVASL